MSILSPISIIPIFPFQTLSYYTTKDLNTSTNRDSLEYWNAGTTFQKENFSFSIEEINYYSWISFESGEP